MPEMTFAIEWPDGRMMDCYSPSLVMHDFLTEGHQYPVQQFVDRSSQALDQAADRVKERFGFTCTSAMAQQDKIVSVAAKYLTDYAGGMVTVLRMEPPLPEPAHKENRT